MRLRQYFFRFALFIVILLLFSCSKSLEDRILEAEKSISENNKIEALELYAEIISDIHQYGKLERMGYEYQRFEALEIVIKSLNNNLNNENERIEFYNKFISNNPSSYISDLEDIIIAIMHTDNMSEDSRYKFFDDYFNNVSNLYYSAENSYFLDDFSLMLSLSPYEIDKKFELIKNYYTKYSYEQYLSENSYPKQYGFESNILNELYGSVVDNNIQLKVMQLNIVDSSMEQIEDITDPDNFTGLYDYEYFLDTDKYELNLQDDFTPGKFIPVDLLEMHYGTDKASYNISNLYYYIPDEYRPESVEDIEQIAFLKTLKIKTGVYVDSNGSEVGNAYQIVTNVCFLDIESNQIVDIQSFLGSEAAEEIMAESSSIYNFDIGDSPINDVAEYLFGNGSEQALPVTIELLQMLFAIE